MIKFKKTAFAVSLCALFSLVFFSSAKADVYGYQLRIHVYDNGVLQADGASTQSASDLAAGLVTFKLEAIDPSGVPVAVSSWEGPSISSKKSDGTSITSGAGLFGLSGAASALESNIYNGSVSLVSGNGTNGYYGIISARADIDGHKTNYVSYQLTIAQESGAVTSTTTTPTETPIIQTVADTAKTTTTTVSNVISNALEKTTGIPKEQAPVALSTASAVSAVATAPLVPIASASTVLSIPELLHSIWYSFLSFLGLTRRKKKNFGKVVESGSNIPLSQAKVVLKKIVSPDSEKIVATTFTDKDGIFGLIAEPGEYQIEVTKDNYSVVQPSGDFYAPGQKIVVSSYSEGMAVPLVAMSMSERNVKKQFGKLRRVDILGKILVVISFGLLAFGSVVAIQGLLSGLNTRSVIIAAVYLVLWIINLTVLTKRSPWGEVVDKLSNSPIPLTLIRITDKEGHLIKTAISNQIGKFSALLGQGDYHLLASKTGYSQEKPLDLSVKQKITTLTQKVELSKN